jgi:hypothetical protein
MNLVGTPSSVSLILIWDAGTASLPPARFMERRHTMAEESVRTAMAVSDISKGT